MDEEKEDVEEFLNDSFGKELVLPESAKFSMTKKSKIEKLGQEAMKNIFDLAQNTDLTHGAIAQKINEIYGLEESKAINRQNIIHFFRTNGAVLAHLAEEKKSLNKIRAELYLEHNGVLVKDIKKLDMEIEKLLDDDMIESDKRAKAMGDLIDKKGRLLLRHARLSGRLKEDRVQSATQINIYNEVQDEKSELIKRLKKAEFRGEKVVEVEVNGAKSVDG